ncbi:hypothetical protein [Thiococcus pfennigii]|jgi:hypothetical protein|uniref:hypothetical protein n=1 Tax=Thiococcus pfennigii TaxID=1057 RepID=UPI001904840E|nr:hypothetical protein [Thiococcus pfennigii]MBK1702647.1 hypothetical protein [Thiococcus pfennigii]MBK1731207.1 hypothetical protein [Thiococcus pfennigii]
MPHTRLLHKRLLAVFLAALLLLFSPLVLPLEGAGRWFGIPVLFIYLFAVWGGVIAAAAWVLSRLGD